MVGFYLIVVQGVYMIKKISKSNNITDSQKEMRTAFLGGFAGQLVSGLIWIGAAAISLWGAPHYGMAFLFFGSICIFPFTQLILRLMGRPAKVCAENGLWALGSQISFTVPINFLLVGVVILYREDWFFPAAMIVVGSHYIPFITLYGMKMFGVLAALLILAGTGLAIYGPPVFSLAGWLTGLILIVFAFLGRVLVLKEEQSSKSSLPTR